MRSKLLLIISMMMIGCQSGNDNILFHNEQLQSVVEQFVDEVGTIKNPEGKPTIVLVNFFKTFPGYENDTLVILRPALDSYCTLTETWDSSSFNCQNGPTGMGGTLVGASYIGPTICEIVYDGFDSLPGLVNEDALSLRPEDYIRGSSDVDDSLLHEWFRHEYVKYNKIRIYRLDDTDNSLVLLESR